MKIILKIMSILFVSFLFCAPSFSLAEDDYEEGVGWTISDGILTITANGGLEDFFNYDRDQNGKPRYQHDGNDVKSVVIGKNVTKFVMYAFGDEFYPTSMHVEEGNKIFSVVDGWLTNLQTKTLICATDLDRFIRIPVARKMPASVEKIGVDAFYAYNHIIQIYIPDSVIEIEDRAFDSCEGLETIQLPSKLKIIGPSAFDYCTSLQKVTMGSSIERIDKQAFASCYNLKRVNLENTRITVLNEDVFSFTALNSIVLPETLRLIEPEAFANCRFLYSVTVCSDDIVIRNRAFAACDRIRKIIFTKGVPKTMSKDLFGALGETPSGKCFLSDSFDSRGKEIPYPTLYYTAEYAAEWAPNGETEWNGYPIRQLTEKEERALPSGLDHQANAQANASLDVDHEAGSGWVFDSGKLLLTTNSGLDDFTANDLDENFANKHNHFPSEVETLVIGKDVSQFSPVTSYGFWYFSPTTIQIEPGNPYFIRKDGYIMQAQTGTLVGPENYPNFGNTTVLNTIPDNTRIIGQSAFDQYHLPYWCEEWRRPEIEQVAFPSSLIVIDQYAFASCERIVQLDFPASLTSIGNFAFLECLDLQNIHFGPVRSLGASAFFECFDLVSVNLEDTQITDLRQSVFGRCRSLTTMILPDTLLTVETQAFQACESLKTVIFQSDQVTIQPKAFEDCIGLKYLIFRKGVPAAFGESLLGETAKTADGRYYISNYYPTKHQPIPYPTLLYTAEYAAEWAPNGETEWNGYPIQQISQAELDAILVQARGEAGEANASESIPMPAPTVAPASTEAPALVSSPLNGWMIAAIAIAVLAAGVVVIGVVRGRRK